MKGNSTLYDRDGQPILEWVKTREDAAQHEEYMAGIVEALQAEIEPSAPLVEKGRRAPSQTERTLVVPFADLHLGQRPSGSGPDTEYQGLQVKAAFRSILHNAPPR